MRRPIFILIICLMAGQVFGQSLKKYAGEFLYLGAGSRILAMGGAGTAVANDVTATYWNPAGLMEAKGLQVEFMHSKQFISSIQNNFLAASIPINDHQSLGLSLLYLTVNGIKDSRQAFNEADQKVDYSKIRIFNTGDYVAVFSYASNYKNLVNFGVNLKTIYRNYHSAKAYGVGLDLGLKYFWKNLAAGLIIRDVTSTIMAWDNGTRELITPSARFGLSYVFHIPKLNLDIQPAADFNFLLENRRYASQNHLGPLSLDTFWGAEFRYGRWIALRAGLDDLNRFSTGIGINIPKISFDYSFTSYQSELGDIHRISVHIQLLQNKTL